MIGFLLATTVKIINNEDWGCSSRKDPVDGSMQHRFQSISALHWQGLRKRLTVDVNVFFQPSQSEEELGFAESVQ